MKSKNRSNRSTKSSPDDKLLTKLVTTNFKGTDAKRTVVLPATSASYIDWGDGTIIENPTLSDLTHTYNKQKQYTIEAVFDWNNSTKINNWSNANKLNWLSDVTQFGLKTYGKYSGHLLQTGVGAFAGFAGQDITALKDLNTKNLSSMYRMFSGARLFNQDLGAKFLGKNITNAFAMFSDANVFNNGGEASIGQWNTSNVTYMRSMFEGAGLFNQDLSDWDTSAVRDPQNEAGKGGMENMFKNTPVFAADLSDWDVKALDSDLQKNFNTSLGDNEQGVSPNFEADPENFTLNFYNDIYYLPSSRVQIGNSSSIFSFEDFDSRIEYLLSLSLSPTAIEEGITFELGDPNDLTAATGYVLQGKQTSLGAVGSVEAIQSALDSLKLDTNDSDIEFNLDVNITEKMDDLYFNPGKESRNYYQYFEQKEISWSDAMSAAEAKTLYEQEGHLTTIRTKEENDFIAEKTSAQNIWIGARDNNPNEGDWKWVGGPDNDIQFWEGFGDEKGGSAVNDEFDNWNSPVEPNNAGGEEHYAVTNWNSKKGEWNDLRNQNQNSKVNGYLVEYEQPDGGWFGDQQVTFKLQTPSSFTVDGLTSVNLFGDQSGSGTILTLDPEGLTESKGQVSVQTQPRHGNFNFTESTGEYTYTFDGNNSTNLPDSDSFSVSIQDDAGFTTTESIVIALNRDVDDRFEGDSSINVIEDKAISNSLDYSDRQNGTELEVNANLNIENEGDIVFGPGKDQLENKCVLNVSNGLITMGNNDDILTTNTYISTNALDGGQGFDQLFLTDDACDEVTGVKKAIPMQIDGFEVITIQGGKWMIEGDHSNSLIRVGLQDNDSGIMQIPLQERSQFGLKADRLRYKDGEISVVLDLEQVSSPTKGRWRVIKGLSSKSRRLLQNDLNQLSLDLIGSGPDDSFLEPNWKFRGDKLLLSITDLLE